MGLGRFLKAGSGDFIGVAVLAMQSLHVGIEDFVIRRFFRTQQLLLNNNSVCNSTSFQKLLSEKERGLSKESGDVV